MGTWNIKRTNKPKSIKDENIQLLIGMLEISKLKWNGLSVRRSYFLLLGA